MKLLTLLTYRISTHVGYCSVYLCYRHIRHTQYVILIDIIKWMSSTYDVGKLFNMLFWVMDWLNKWRRRDIIQYRYWQRINVITYFGIACKEFKINQLILNSLVPVRTLVTQLPSAEPKWTNLHAEIINCDIINWQQQYYVHVFGVLHAAYPNHCLRCEYNVTTETAQCFWCLDGFGIRTDNYTCTGEYAPATSNCLHIISVLQTIQTVL